MRISSKMLWVFLVFTGCSPANPVPVFQLTESLVQEIPRFSFWSRDSRTFIIVDASTCDRPEEEKDDEDETILVDDTTSD